MVKKILTIILFTFILFVDVSCSRNKNNNNSIPPSEEMLQKINLKSVDNVLLWNVSLDEQYDIYRNDTIIDTVSKGTYVISQGRTDDTEYYVSLHNSDIKSNKVTISSDIYKESEILDLSSKSSYKGVIDKKYRKVIIGNNNISTFYLEVEIENRFSSLEFELNNVSINGYIHSENKNYKELNYDVIININGACSITGIDGLNGQDFSDSFYDNLELNAGKGKDGNDAIIIPKVSFKGEGNFVIRGGNGGNGGIGSCTTAWEESMFPGKGSNGGNGGAAIITSYLLINSTEDINVVIKDGVGGGKGVPGTNGSIITGPLVSLIWESEFNIGKNGNKGESFIGNKYILTGGLNYE